MTFERVRQGWSSGEQALVEAAKDAVDLEDRKAVAGRGVLDRAGVRLRDPVLGSASRCNAVPVSVVAVGQGVHAGRARDRGRGKDWNRDW